MFKRGAEERQAFIGLRAVLLMVDAMLSCYDSGKKKKHLVFFKSYRSIVVSLMNTSINTVTSYWPVVYMMCSYSGSQFKK